MGWRSAAVVVIALSAATPRVGAQDRPEPEDAPRNFANLRVGVSSADRNRRPQLCAEGSPLAFLSVEACGTGAGFLHRDPEAELAHFRAKLRVVALRADARWLELFAAAGFAELQIGVDAPGFDFSGTDESASSTAGPEAGIALRMPIELDADLELLADVNVSLAWLPHADELVVPFAELQPSASLTVGLGF